MAGLHQVQLVTQRRHHLVRVSVVDVLRSLRIVRLNLLLQQRQHRGVLGLPRRLKLIQLRAEPGGLLGEVGDRLPHLAPWGGGGQRASPHRLVELPHLGEVLRERSLVPPVVGVGVHLLQDRVDPGRARPHVAELRQLQLSSRLAQLVEQQVPAVRDVLQPNLAILLAQLLPAEVDPVPPQDRLRLPGVLRLQRVQQEAAHRAGAQLQGSRPLVRSQQARVRRQGGGVVLEEADDVLARAGQPLLLHLHPQQLNALVDLAGQALLLVGDPASQHARVAVHPQLVVRVERHRVHQDVERVPDRCPGGGLALGLPEERERGGALRQRLVPGFEVQRVQLGVRQRPGSVLLVLVQVRSRDLPERPAERAEHSRRRRIQQLRHVPVLEDVLQLLLELHAHQLLQRLLVLLVEHEARLPGQLRRHCPVHHQLQQRHHLKLPLGAERTRHHQSRGL